MFITTYPKWPHRQCVGLAFRRSRVRPSLAAASHAICAPQGRVDDFSFLDCLSPFCFLLIEFHCSFSISYKIQTNYLYYYYILISIVYAIGYCFCRARFTCFHTHAYLLIFFVCLFILFRSCSHAQVFGKTLVHEFLISYCHTEWYLLFFDSATTSAQCLFGLKN